MYMIVALLLLCNAEDCECFCMQLPLFSSTTGLYQDMRGSTRCVVDCSLTHSLKAITRAGVRGRKEGIRERREREEKREGKDGRRIGREEGGRKEGRKGGEEGGREKRRKGGRKREREGRHLLPKQLNQ